MASEELKKEPVDQGQKGQDTEETAQETVEAAEKNQDLEAEERKAGTEPDGKSKGKKDPKDIQIEELQDRLKRQMAEFDNFRKRTEKEKASMYEFGVRDMVEKILPVVDNFERGRASIADDDKGSPFAEGMEMVYKQMMKTLEDAGVKAIEALGQPFDPNLHNAVMHVEDGALGENVVAQELQKGYRYRETVIRHSMVQVAN